MEQNDDDNDDEFFQQMDPFWRKQPTASYVNQNTPVYMQHF